MTEVITQPYDQTRSLEPEALRTDETLEINRRFTGLVEQLLEVPLSSEEEGSMYIGRKGTGISDGSGFEAYL